MIIVRIVVITGNHFTDYSSSLSPIIDSSGNGALLPKGFRISCFGPDLLNSFNRRKQRGTFVVDLRPLSSFAGWVGLAVLEGSSWGSIELGAASLRGLNTALGRSSRNASGIRPLLCRNAGRSTGGRSLLPAIDVVIGMNFRRCLRFLVVKLPEPSSFITYWWWRLFSTTVPDRLHFLGWLPRQLWRKHRSPSFNGRTLRLRES